MNPIVILYIRNGIFYRAFTGLLVVALALGLHANGWRWTTHESLDSNANWLHPIPAFPPS